MSGVEPRMRGLHIRPSREQARLRVQIVLAEEAVNELVFYTSERSRSDQPIPE